LWLLVRGDGRTSDTSGSSEAATPEAIDDYLQRLLTADSLVAVFED